MGEYYIYNDYLYIYIMVQIWNTEATHIPEDAEQNSVQALQWLAQEVTTSVSTYIDARYNTSQRFESDTALTEFESKFDEIELSVDIQWSNLTTAQALWVLQMHKNKELADLDDVLTKRAITRITMTLSQEVGQAARAYMKKSNPNLLTNGFASWTLDQLNLPWTLAYTSLDIDSWLATFLNSPLWWEILDTQYTYIQQGVISECSQIMQDTNTYIHATEQEKKWVMEKVKSSIDDMSTELSKLNDADVDQWDKVKIWLKYLFGAFFGYQAVKWVAQVFSSKKWFWSKLWSWAKWIMSWALAWSAFKFDLDLSALDEKDVPTPDALPAWWDTATWGTVEEWANTVAEAQKILKDNPEFAKIANDMWISVNTFWKPISGDTDQLWNFWSNQQEPWTVLMHLNQFGTVWELLSYKSIATRMSVANMSDFEKTWKVFYYENKAFLAGTLEWALPDADLPTNIWPIQVPAAIKKSADFFQWIDDILESTQYDAETRLLMYQDLQWLFRQQMKVLVRLDQAVQALPEEQYMQIQDVHLFTNDPHDPNSWSRILEKAWVYTKELIPQQYITLVQTQNEQLALEQAWLHQDIETIQATWSVDSSQALEITESLSEDIEYSMWDIRYEKFLSWMSQIINTDGMERKDILRASWYDQLMKPLLDRNTEIAQILKSKKTLWKDDIDLLKELSRMRQDQVQMYNELMVFADFSMEKHEDNEWSYLLGTMDLSGSSLLSAWAKRATDISWAYTWAWKWFGTAMSWFALTVYNPDKEWFDQLVDGVWWIVAGTGQLAWSLLALDLFTLVPGVKTVARTPAALLKKTGIIGRGVWTAMDIPFKAIERISPTNLVWRLTDYATNHALSKWSLRMKPAYLAKKLTFAWKEWSKKLLYHLLYNDLSANKAHSVLWPWIRWKIYWFIKEKKEILNGSQTKSADKINYLYKFLIEQEDMLKVFDNGAPVTMWKSQIKRLAKIIEHGYMWNREMRRFLLQMRPGRNMSEIVFNKDAFKKIDTIMKSIEALWNKKITDKRMFHAMVRHMHPDQLWKVSWIIKNYKLIKLSQNLSDMWVSATEFGKILWKNLHHIDDPKDLSKMINFVQEYKASRPRAVVWKVFVRMWTYMKKIKSVNFKVSAFIKKFPKIQLWKHIPQTLTQHQIYTKTRRAASTVLKYFKKYPNKLKWSNVKMQALSKAMNSVRANPTTGNVKTVLAAFSKSQIGKLLGTVFVVVLEWHAAYSSYSHATDIAELNPAKAKMYMDKACVEAGLWTTWVAAVFLWPPWWAAVWVGAVLTGLHQMKESYYGTMDLYLTNSKEFLQKSLPKLSAAMYALAAGQFSDERSWKEIMTRFLSSEDLDFLGITSFQSAMEAWIRLDTLQQHIDRGDDSSRFYASLLLNIARWSDRDDAIVSIEKIMLQEKNDRLTEGEKLDTLPENEHIDKSLLWTFEKHVDIQERSRWKYLKNTCGVKKIPIYAYKEVWKRARDKISIRYIKDYETVIDFWSEKAGIQESMSSNMGLWAMKWLMTQSRIAQMHIHEETNELDMNAIQEEEEDLQAILDDTWNIAIITKAKIMIQTNPRLFMLYYASIQSLLETWKLSNEQSQLKEVLEALIWEYMRHLEEKNGCVDICMSDHIRYKTCCVI